VWISLALLIGLPIRSVEPQGVPDLVEVDGRAAVRH